DEHGRDRERGGHAAEGQLHAVEHAVHQRSPLHNVAHEDEKGDREQRVVGHHPVGPLGDQVEDTVVVPVGARDPEGDEAEHHAEAHQGERGGIAHHDRRHDEPQHEQTERRIAHWRRSSSRTACSCTTPSSRTLRWRAASSMALAPSIAARRDSSSTYWLWPSWVSMTSISSTSASRGGQAPVRMQTTQRRISARPCSITSTPATGMTVLNW